MFTPDLEPARTLPAPSTATMVFMLGIGIAFDLALHGQRPGVSIPVLTVLLITAAARWTPRSPGEDLLLTSAGLLSIFPALLANAALIALDLVTVCALLGLATARDERGLFRATIVSLLRRAGLVLGAVFRAPVIVLAPVVRFTGALPRGRWRGMLRATAITAPIVAIFAALLASADAVFGELLVPSLPTLDLGGAVTHLGLMVAGLTGAAALWLAAQRRVGDDVFGQQSLLPNLRAADVTTVLVALDLLFAVFVAVQFAVLFGGHGRVEVTPGLTYAEYARSGFFQLITVAGLVVAVILAAWDMGDVIDPRQRQRFRVLVSVMVAMCSVILVSALMRLALYEQTFGFTLNRLGGYLAIGFIGFVLLALVVVIWAGARERVVALLLAGCLLTLVAANLINPERFVAERNVARYEGTGKIDLVYLGMLGADAVPVTTELLAQLPDAQATMLASLLCEQLRRLEPEPGWRSANLARASALDAFARAGIDGGSCALSRGYRRPAAVPG